MNGEVKSYKLNDTMSWAEFKAMPDDIKITYITALRKRFNVSDTKIAEMLGEDQSSFSYLCRRLGIKSTRKSKENWDKDGWYAWVNGLPVEAKEELAYTVRDTEENAAEAAAFEAEQERIAEDVKRKLEDGLKKCDEEVLKPTEKCDAVVQIVPCRGQMTMQGKAADVLESVKNLLGNASVTITFAWCTDEAAGVKCDG